MSNLNAQLTAFAKKLESFHISNEPTIHKVRSQMMVKKAKPSAFLRSNTNKRKTIKTRRTAKHEERRHQATLRAKAARTAKRKQATEKRKKNEEEAAQRVVLEGRTRGQTRKLKSVMKENNNE